MNRNGWENHWHPTGLHHAALNRLDHLRHIAMTRIKVAKGIGNTDNWPVQGTIAIAHRFNKGFAQK